jgi:hypothetical protein
MLSTMEMPGYRVRWFLVGILLCSVFAVVGRAVYETERLALLNLEEQFRSRVDVAEPFLRSYVENLLKRERDIAERELSADTIPAATFDTVVRAFGFEAAVVTDSKSTLLHVYPAKPQALGTYVGGRYAHLRNALVDGAAISSVVPSAAIGAPIVGFAVRYGTASGTRVFSGAYDVRMMPLHVYMSNLLAFRSASADLIDANGAIVASNRRGDVRSRELQDVDPSLVAALRATAGYGTYDGKIGSRIFVKRAVTSTPWRLVLAVDEQELHAPLGGKRRWLHWGLFAGWFAATLATALLWRRLYGTPPSLEAR